MYDFYYKLSEKDNKEVMSYYGRVSSNREKVFIIDYDEIMKIKDIDSKIITKIKNGFNISYDFIDFLMIMVFHIFLKIYLLGIRSFDSGSVKIDYFLNDNSLKLKSIIDINYMNNNVLKNVKFDITTDIKIDKDESFEDDFWLS